MNELDLTPKDNELRMQVGFRLTHEPEHILYVADVNGDWKCPMMALKELLALVRADEREECAKVADEMSEDVMRFEYWQTHALELCAESIRARGEQE